MKGSAKMIPSYVTRAIAGAFSSPSGLARHRIGILAVLLVIPAAVARAQVGEIPPKPVFADNVPVVPHESLAEVSLPNTTIDSVELNDADGSCCVRATVTHPPTGCRVKVFVALPTKGWNGRFQGTGGGGYVGGNPDGLSGPLRLGFAAAATDTGHEGGSGSFALGADGRLDWHAVQDNAYLGIHEMTVVGKALTRAFYGKAPRYSYFVGGSTGGRQGLMEAPRYPEDYDGILSACPAINWHRFLPADLWPQVVMVAAGNLVPKAKLDAATAAAVASGDASDGVTDGVIDDPSRCAYDPKELVGTKVGDSTFTEADADVVRKIWEGPRGQDGKFLWYGLARGTDLSARRDEWFAAHGKALLHSTRMVPVLPAPGPEMGLDDAHAGGVRAPVEAIGRGIRRRHRDGRPGPDPISRPGWQDHHHPRPGRPAHPGRRDHRLLQARPATDGRQGGGRAVCSPVPRAWRRSRISRPWCHPGRPVGGYHPVGRGGYAPGQAHGGTPGRERQGDPDPSIVPVSAGDQVQG